MVDVKIENNTVKVLGEFGSAMGRVLYAIGVSAQGDVIKEMNRTIYTRDPKKKYTYKLTGRLRGSVSFITPEQESGVKNDKAQAEDALSGKADENTVIIGTNVEYAEKVNRKRKFMENGIEPNWDKYQKIAKDIFKGKL